ncbi:DUF5691 domain-containing protein [Actinomadura scrupuli]|uniref:DUF5691 domain-containing protein n=1 Tax=Actinomadura scrupuli TaxID=559629 RepID=UPI003D96C13A
MSIWTEHVTAALLGTQRRRAPALPEAPATGGSADPAGRLLDQAAVLTAGRRAGLRALRAEPIAPAPAETLPAVGPEAARRLREILDGRQIRMLPEWLDAAARCGYRVPARLLPDLLEKGRGDRTLRPRIAAAAGRRGLWLALQNPDWAYLTAEVTTAREPAGGKDGEPDVWETGTRGQRVARLRGLRAEYPERARTALAETWAKEPAADRVAFLATFEHGLSGADEEFLEHALDDRAKDVRAVAADLLARLPGSAYGERMAERARSCLRPERRTVRQRTQTWVVVRPPDGHDEGMGRDGVPFHPAGSFVPDSRSGAPVGTRAAWLREIIARTPLATWTALFGAHGPASPMEVVCLPIADDFARDVHLGWARAAVRQRDARWAQALLKGGVVLEEVEALADLLGVLPEPERDSAAADLTRWVDGKVDLLRVLDRIPAPWTGTLADTVLGVLAEELRHVAPAGSGGAHGDSARFLAQLCRLADERLTPDVAPRLDELGRRHPGCWPLTELTETLRFRHDMVRELLPGPP